MKRLYKFYCDCGRMGDLEGIFVATREEIKKVVGKTVVLQEVLGKHSEIVLEFKSVDDGFDVLTDDQEFIEKAEQYGLVPTGINPLSYFYEEEDE